MFATYPPQLATKYDLSKYDALYQSAFFYPNIDSLGALPSTWDTLKKYGFFSYFDQWFIDSSFPSYFTWKTIVYSKIRELKANAWDTFITDHPDLYVAQACLEKASPRKFWSISEQFPDLVCCLHTQVRLMGSLGLNGRILWLKNTEGTLCFICNWENETPSHFLFVSASFRRYFDSLWASLVSKIHWKKINQNHMMVYW